MSGTKDSENGKFKPEQLGQEDLNEYLKNKRTGGRNFEKGHNYENKFAIKKLAKVLDVHFQTGADHRIASQREEYFVDDLVIETEKGDTYCWQLKNVLTLSWGAGKRGTVGFDFYHQLKCRKNGCENRLSLVVSDQSIAAQLEKTKPTELAPCTVKHFPDLHIKDLITKGHLDKALAAIARKSNPSLELLEQIARLLLAHWSFRKERLRRL